MDAGWGLGHIMIGHSQLCRQYNYGLGLTAMSRSSPGTLISNFTFWSA